MPATATPLTSDQTVVRHVRQFPCRFESCADARQFVRSVWPDAADDVVLATSELAANAVEHAGTAFEICIEVADGRTGVAVRDWAPKTWPRPPAGSDLAERGRGLRLVGSLARRWGWTVSTGSKVVWFQV